MPPDAVPRSGWSDDSWPAGTCDGSSDERANERWLVMQLPTTYLLRQTRTIALPMR